MPKQQPLDEAQPMRDNYVKAHRQAAAGWNATGLTARGPGGGTSARTVMAAPSARSGGGTSARSGISSYRSGEASARSGAGSARSGYMPRYMTPRSERYMREVVEGGQQQQGADSSSPTGESSGGDGGWWGWAGFGKAPSPHQPQPEQTSGRTPGYMQPGLSSRRHAYKAVERAHQGKAERVYTARKQSPETERAQRPPTADPRFGAPRFMSPRFASARSQRSISEQRPWYEAAIKNMRKAATARGKPTGGTARYMTPTKGYGQHSKNTRRPTNLHSHVPARV